MNIIIIGDIMLDINYNSKITRTAPEADIPIYNILDTTYNLGGASNVAQNLKNLGAKVILISVIGDDNYSENIKDILKMKNIYHRLFVEKERKTTQKNRIFIDNILKVRYDDESLHYITSESEKNILQFITNISDIDAIVISDYDKGVLTETLSEQIIQYSNSKNIPTFVDPKIKNYMKYKNCFLFKPNQNEAEIISGEKNIEKILCSIKQKINCENILLTRSKEGMILNNIHQKIEHDNIIKLVDVTGAGDVVLSTLVYVYLLEKDLLKACYVANYVGGKSVGVVGNYKITNDDIKEYYDNNIENNKIIYDYEINKIEQIKKNNNIVFTNGCFDILHSAHIELLKFCKGLGDKLVVGLNSDNSIKRLKGEYRPINDISERSKILSLFDFIDYIIIFDEDTPLNVIKTLKPNILVKGSDYNLTNIVGKEYVNNVVFFDLIHGKSSTNVINKINLINNK